MDTNLASFDADVLAVSHQVPVLADFWAPWCGPCNVLGPLLEKLEAEAQGRIRLVKVNADENAQLCAEYGVRSLPTVVAFVDGEPVDQFVGALPEGQLRAFIERIVPNPAEMARRVAREALAEGRPEAARDALQAALALDPAHDDVRLDLVDVLLGMGDAQAARTELTLLSPRTAASGDARIAALTTRIEAAERASHLPPAQDLLRRVQAEPDNLQARLDLANRYLAERAYEPALQALLEIVQRDRSFADDAARKSMLAIFDALSGTDPATVSAWRRKLSAALN
ncbi:thioredoxin [Pandoraea nosoerga]|uniref:thioredoxin n=1 Tax=Pandoraea TaxID=93217 RepID=UPI0012417A9E|nr:MULTISPECIES: thioredoxin [Pandoraea]MBN4667868.1 thioredoxin [Pandoraea nosoerga]MBN4676527.1 thioredoxin [Pandoraea nosoerga]MBN4682816.1 thioredoxin [Pandoraea nosoerga]MBN4745693.1 thioredoxin [Pandoraea nosoerga]